MTPEKNIKVENKVNKIKSSAAENIFRVGLATAMLFGVLSCVPIEAIVTTPTPETSPLPFDFTPTPISSPTEAPFEFTPTVINSATQELTLVSPTAVATEMPIITLTPEPTVIATQEIDFSVPGAPENVDPEKWREAYVSGMLSSGYLRLKVEAGLVEPSWNEKMDTMIWDLGDDEKFGYNSEFKFTGAVVSDVYDNDWIVRKKLTHSRGIAGSIFWFDRLHVKDKEELILGAQCVEQLTDSLCGLVGQVVGQEKIDMSQYLIDDFDSLNSYDAGIFFNRKNLVFDALVVRVPNGNNEYVELRVPLTPNTMSEEKDILTFLSGPKGLDISGKEVIEKSKEGSMVYLFFLVTHELPPGLTEEIYKQSSPRFLEVGQIHNAFGVGESTALILDEYFDIHVPEQFVPLADGRPTILETEKLGESKITSMPRAILVK